MCVAFLAKESVDIDFLGEYIHCHSSTPDLRFKEVYDVFFTPKEPLPHFQFVCFSPHDLLTGASLAVSTGKQPETLCMDPMYHNGSGRDPYYDGNSNTLSINVFTQNSDGSPVKRESFEGQFIVPTPRLVPFTEGSEEYSDIMSAYGTLFQLETGPLKSSVTYVFRLEVSPHRLLPVEKNYSRVIREDNPLYPLGRREKRISVLCPKNCMNRLDTGLTRELKSELSDYARTLHQFVFSPSLQLLRAGRHRIVVISPPGATLRHANDQFCICPLKQPYWIPTTGGEERQADEWIGGIKMYYIEDVQACAELILDLLAREPMSKRDLNAETRIPFPNLARLLQKLCDDEVIVREQNNYRLLNPQAVFADIAANMNHDFSLNADFARMTYSIDCIISYTFLDLRKKLARVWYLAQQVVNIWIALAALALTILALVFT